MKKKLKTHLAYSWWGYLLLAAAVSTLWWQLFRAASQPKENEALLISFIGTAVDTDAIEAQFKAALPALTQQEVKLVTVEHLRGEDSYTLSQLLFSRCLSADVVVMGREAMFEGIGDGYFAPLEEAEIVSALGGVSFYREGDAAYGIELPGADAWLFFTVNSPNAGGLNGQGRVEDDAALQFAKWLLWKEAGENAVQAQNSGA